MSAKKRAQGGHGFARTKWWYDLQSLLHSASLPRNPEGSVKPIEIELPNGQLTVLGQVENGNVTSADVLRTTRKLIGGLVF